MNIQKSIRLLRNVMCVMGLVFIILCVYLVAQLPDSSMLPTQFIPTSSTPVNWNDWTFIIGHNNVLSYNEEKYGATFRPTNSPRYRYYLFYNGGEILRRVERYYECDDKVYVIAEEGYAILYLENDTYEIYDDLLYFEEEDRDIFVNETMFTLLD